MDRPVRNMYTYFGQPQAAPTSQLRKSSLRPSQFISCRIPNVFRDFNVELQRE